MGMPSVDFYSMLSGIGDTLQNGKKQADADAFKDKLKQWDANGRDLSGLASILFGSGDVAAGLKAVELGDTRAEKQRTRDADAAFISGITGGDKPAASPSGGASMSDEPKPTGRVMTMPVDPAIKDGIAKTANALGIDPVHLATAISYETGGTFDPVQPGPTTQWGQHRGLIQFGEPQAKENGVDWANPIETQLGENGAIANYLRKAGVQPGMGLRQIYSAINAGRVGRDNASDANNGGAPGTVADKVRSMGDHYARAKALYADAGSSTATDAGGDPDAPAPGATPTQFQLPGGHVDKVVAPLENGDLLPNVPTSKLMAAVGSSSLSEASRGLAKTLLQERLQRSRLGEAEKGYLRSVADGSFKDGGFFDYQKALKASTTVNVDTGGDAESKKLGEARGQRAAELEASGANAPSQLAKLNLLGEILSKGSTGALGDMHGTAVGTLQGLGFKDDTIKGLGLNPNQAITKEAGQKIINELTVGMIGKGGFPANNFSDADRTFLTKIFPSIANRPEANALALDVMKAVEQRKMDVAQAWGEYQDTHEKPSIAKFEREWAQKVKGEALFKDAYDRLRSMSPSGQPGGPTSAPGAARGGLTNLPPGMPPPGAGVAAPAAPVARRTDVPPVRVWTPEEAARLPRGTPILMGPNAEPGWAQ